MYVQIKSESFLEDINNILNSGDVPNIYPPEDLDKIFSEMKPVVQDAGLQPTKSNLFSAYTKRVRSNIHMVICMRWVHMHCTLKGVAIINVRNEWERAIKNYFHTQKNEN